MIEERNEEDSTNLRCWTTRGLPMSVEKDNYAVQGFKRNLSAVDGETFLIMEVYARCVKNFGKFRQEKVRMSPRLYVDIIAVIHKYRNNNFELHPSPSILSQSNVARRDRLESRFQRTLKTLSALQIFNYKAYILGEWGSTNHDGIFVVLHIFLAIRSTHFTGVYPVFMSPVRAAR